MSLSPTTPPTAPPALEITREDASKFRSVCIHYRGLTPTCAADVKLSDATLPLACFFGEPVCPKLTLPANGDQLCKVVGVLRKRSLALAHLAKYGNCPVCSWSVIDKRITGTGGHVGHGEVKCANPACAWSHRF